MFIFMMLLFLWFDLVSRSSQFHTDIIFFLPGAILYAIIKICYLDFLMDLYIASPGRGR